MPLVKGYSKKSIRTNIARERKRQVPRAQAVATSLEIARRAWRNKHPRGPFPKYLRTK